MSEIRWKLTLLPIAYLPSGFVLGTCNTLPLRHGHLWNEKNQEISGHPTFVGDMYTQITTMFTHRLHVAAQLSVRLFAGLDHQSKSGLNRGTERVVFLEDHRFLPRATTRVPWASHSVPLPCIVRQDRQHGCSSVPNSHTIWLQRYLLRPLHCHSCS